MSVTASIPAKGSAGPATGVSLFESTQAVKPAPTLKELLAKPDLTPAQKAGRASQESFLSVLSQHVKDGVASKPFDSLSAKQKTERAKQAAEELVAVAFVQPILKNLRGGGVMGELPAPFGPGAGEKQFRTIADAQMARHLVHASRWGLVDSITRKMLTAKQSMKQQIETAEAQPGSPAAIRRAKLKNAALLPSLKTGSTLDTLH